LFIPGLARSNQVKYVADAVAAGVTEFDAGDTGLVPAPLDAWTLKV
jgi:hypothetical protein